MKILMDSSIKKKLHQHFCQEFHWNLCTYSRTFDKIYKMLGFNYGIHDEQF
jgi:Zn-finger domain-containing protein